MYRLFLACLALATIGSAQRRPATVVLSDPPLVEYLASSSRDSRPRDRLLTPAAEAYRGFLQQGQARFLRNMQGRRIPVERQLDTVLNAIIIQATEEDLTWLRS